MMFYVFDVLYFAQSAKREYQIFQEILVFVLFFFYFLSGIFVGQIAKSNRHRIDRLLNVIALEL